MRECWGRRRIKVREGGFSLEKGIWFVTDRCDLWFSISSIFLLKVL
jgi:hypothetical protein